MKKYIRKNFTSIFHVLYMLMCICLIIMSVYSQEKYHFTDNLIFIGINSVLYTSITSFGSLANHYKLIFNYTSPFFKELMWVLANKYIVISNLLILLFTFLKATYFSSIVHVIITFLTISLLILIRKMLQMKEKSENAYLVFFYYFLALVFCLKLIF